LRRDTYQEREEREKNLGWSFCKRRCRVVFSSGLGREALAEGWRSPMICKWHQKGRGVRRHLITRSGIEAPERKDPRSQVRPRESGGCTSKKRSLLGKNKSEGPRRKAKWWQKTKGSPGSLRASEWGGRDYWAQVDHQAGARGGKRRR